MKDGTDGEVGLDKGGGERLFIFAAWENLQKD